MQRIYPAARQWTLNPSIHSRYLVCGITNVTPTPHPLSLARFYSINPLPKNPQHDSSPKHRSNINGTIAKEGKPYAIGTSLHSGIPRLVTREKTEEYMRKRKRRRRILQALLISSGLLIVYRTANPPPPKKIFDPPRFTPFRIVGREEVSPTSIILTVRPQKFTSKKSEDSDPYKDWWGRGTWSVEVKQPQLQIARSYTPLPPNEHDSNGDLRFLIRREHKGEVSGYLHTLPVGGTVELRGPNPEVDLSENIREVVFLAGGTGIAPALQVAHTLLERQSVGHRAARIRIVWANRKREDCIGGSALAEPLRAIPGSKRGYIVQELQNLQQKYPDHLVVEYLVDEEGTVLDLKKISQLTKSESEVKFGPVTTRIDSKLLFVSGPEGFINYFAGPKRWEGGKEGQGELGGVLGKMRLRDWKVWKL